MRKLVYNFRLMFYGCLFVGNKIGEVKRQSISTVLFSVYLYSKGVDYATVKQKTLLKPEFKQLFEIYNIEVCVNFDGHICMEGKNISLHDTGDTLHADSLITEMGIAMLGTELNESFPILEGKLPLLISPRRRITLLQGLPLYEAVEKECLHFLCYALIIHATSVRLL